MNSVNKAYILRIGVAILAILIIGIYFGFDPEAHPIFPKCILLATTGYKCPGCGMQRLVYHLLHGEVRTAFSYNYLAVLVIPWILVTAACTCLTHSKYARRMLDRLTNRTVGIVYIFLYFLWWIVRNICNL